MIDKLNEIAARHGERRIKGVKFRATDRNKETIYHTDWMMTLFNIHAVICLSAIRDKTEKENVIKELTDPELNVNPKQIIELSFTESENMWANMFDIIDNNGNHWVVMSNRAHESFRARNLETIYSYYKVIIADIDIIENIGGGSARCMLVELM